MDVVKAGRRGLHRKRASKRKDKKVFSKTAGNSRKENMLGNPMRGGIRL